MPLAHQEFLANCRELSTMAIAGEVDRQTDGQTGRQAGRQAGGQTNRRARTACSCALGLAGWPAGSQSHQ